MSQTEAFDVVVVGAGLGGVYAVYRFLKEGLKVAALERADEVGGVWNHNRYPGARVDVDSIEYCYSFSPELYRDWRWSERYASQGELQAYLKHVVERFGLGPHIRLGTPMTGAEWRPDDQRYHITAGDGARLTARFLIMATGNLSAPRDPVIPGLSDFKGEWVTTSRWPRRPVELAGRRVGIIGTGSSGVQATTVVSQEARELFVFQRTAHYAVPAQNGPQDEEQYAVFAADPGLLMEAWRNTKLFGAEGQRSPLGVPQPAASYSAEVQQARLETQWNIGGQKFHVVFADQTRDKAANDIVAEFVRGKIRAIVKDPVTAEKLCPKYPVGTRRLIQADGYYEAFNRDNVTLVDIAESPIRVTETGVQTKDAHYELDLIILALGFKAFVGELDKADIRNEKGETPTTHWGRGPRTLLGLMTAGFPNMFMPTGPGSPSVLANLFPQNEYHVDWIADCIRYLDAHGYASIEPELEAQDRWTERVGEVARPLLRLQGNDYMVHRNGDGTRIFIPWSGGTDAYAEAAEGIAARGYEGFRLEKARVAAVT
jgi:cation diffusion facilitator CzcD-associated flavoprotein CzcO